MVPFQSRSLTSRVPALTHGDFHLTESTAIAEYLEQIYPAPDHLALYPEAPGRARAQLQAWLRGDLGALRQERPTETVFWDQPGQPLSGDAAARPS